MAVITINLTQGDLANIRFGYSPLMELLTSYRLLYKPERQGQYRRWIEEALAATADIELPYIHSVATIPFFIPDFLAPTPLTTVKDIEGEFLRLSSISPEIIGKNMAYASELVGESAIFQQYITDPYTTMQRLIEELRIYWERTLVHHWPHMMSVLDADVLYRARRLAVDGTQALIASLQPELQLVGNQLEYIGSQRSSYMDKTYQLDGSGVQLVPGIFLQSPTWQLEPEWRPMLAYQARGIGLWWRQNEALADESLDIALGTTRARVLRTLTTPSSTGEIAYQLGITSGAASQHLSRLQQAGLTIPRRTGQRVYYHLTPRGEKLLAIFT